MTTILVGKRLANVFLPVAIGGFSYILLRRSKRLSKNKKRLLKLLLISSIGIYGGINYSLFSSILQKVLQKVKNQRSVEAVTLDTQNPKLHRTKKVLIGLTAITITLLVIFSVRYYSEDPVERLIRQIEAVEELTPSLRRRVNKHLAGSESWNEMQRTIQQELADFDKNSILGKK